MIVSEFDSEDVKHIPEVQTPCQTSDLLHPALNMYNDGNLSPDL